MARKIGMGALGTTVLALGVLVVWRSIERSRDERTADLRDGRRRAARYLHGAASILSFSVLTDSAIEHYRGAFHNPGMYVAPLVAAVTLGNGLMMTARPQGRSVARAGLCGLALVTGMAGTGFHAYNVGKREGGFALLNLFYGAPLGAPAAIALAGLAGLAALRLVGEDETEAPAMLLRLPAGPLLGAGTAAGLCGTVAEAALLHFRGAFHDPFMFLPVTVPPLTALMLTASIAKREWRKIARGMLGATALLGLGGMGFHAYGVSRNMGGFGNWRQNVLNGPPLPAPPSFTGIALAGLAALQLLEER